MKAHLSHLYATVSDLAAAQAFWTNLIGLYSASNGNAK